MSFKLAIVCLVLCVIPFVSFYPASFYFVVIFLSDQSRPILCKVISDILGMKGSIKKRLLNEIQGISLKHPLRKASA